MALEIGPFLFAAREFPRAAASSLGQRRVSSGSGVFPRAAASFLGQRRVSSGSFISIHIIQLAL
jgi:hypothetical protein